MLLKKIIKNYENLGLLGVLFEIIRTVSGFNIFLKRKRRTDHKKILKLGNIFKGKILSISPEISFFSIESIFFKSNYYIY